MILKFPALLWLFSYVSVQGLPMKGFLFGDDNIPWKRTPNIGHAEANVSISKQFSFCAWVYMDWIRSYGRYFFIFRSILVIKIGQRSDQLSERSRPPGRSDRSLFN